MRRPLPLCVRWRFTGLGIALLVLGFEVDASSQERNPSAADIALARSLAAEGVQLAEDGNCPAAIERLQRAEALYYAPTIVEPLGECQVAVGKVVAGTENLQRVAREPLPARPPKAFVDAQARARKALEWALPKLARLKIHVDTPPGVKPAVKVDGDAIPLAALDGTVGIEGGIHKIEVSAPGYRTVQRDVTVGEGGSVTASLKLDPENGAVAADPLQAGTTNFVAQPKRSSKTLGYVGLAVGGAGLVLGSVAGLVALSKKSSLDDHCQPRNACPSDAQSDIDTMNAAATVSTIGFAVGAVAAGGGLVLLLTTKASSASTGGASPRSVAIRPFASWGAAGVEGSF